MLGIQEPKYDVNSEGRLFNRSSGEVIPDDEPVFILRARDEEAVHAIEWYRQQCHDKEHQDAVEIRLNQFDEFTLNNPDRMKNPDTDLENILKNIGKNDVR